MRFVLPAALVAVALLASGRAQADDGPLRLAWFAPAGCPSADEVKAAALRGVDLGALGTNAKVPLEADAHVEQQTPSSWRVFLKTRRGATLGERELEAATCAGVADATAVILALALVPPGSAPVAPPVVPPAARPPPVEPPPAASSVDEGPHHFAVGVALVADFGTMPKPAVGGAAHLMWRPSRFWIEAMGRFLGAQTENVPGTNLGADFSIVGVGGRGCFALVQLYNFEASPCVGGGVEIVSAEGRNTDNDLQPTKAWVNLAYGLVARVEVARWLAFRARIEGTSPLYRPNFVVERAGADASSIYRPSSIGAGAYFGAEVLFL